MKKELDIFFTAVMFYTRIPSPLNIDHSADKLNKSTRYFPIIGWIVGGAVGLIFWLACFITPVSVAILLSMAFGIIITGAFHEDGFADVCDGFGGGYTKEARLKIMKDSRIGTYGTVGLVLILLMKYLLISNLTFLSIPIVLLVGHSISRLVPVMVIFTSEYARDDMSSKVKPIGKKISVAGFTFASITSIIPIALFQSWIYLFVIVIPLLSGIVLMRYFKMRIGGYTGDCLGSIQQVSEIAVYFSIYLISNI
jgi:adenosylcobinamide-GDP ribazoletransferase